MMLSWKALTWLVYFSNHLAYGVLQYSLSTQGWTRYASHFDLYGNADGWSSITPNTVPSSAIIYLALSSAITLLVFILPRVLPRRLISLPQPEFWSRSPNFEQAMDWCFYSTLWMQTLSAAQLAFLTVLTLQANQRDPVAMSVVPLYVSNAITLLLIFGLLILLVVRFSKKRKV